MNEGCLCGPPWLMRLCWERQMQHHYITSCVVLPGCMIVFIANSKNFLMPAIRAGWYTSTWGWVTLHKGVQQYWWMSVPQKRKKLYSSSQQTWRSYLWVLNCSTAPSACTTLSVQRVQKHFYFEHENTFFLVSFILGCEYRGWCAQFSLVISLHFHYIWLNISLEKNTFEILKVFFYSFRL